MHECPECGQACDCDGEDVWHAWPYNLTCRHGCEEDDDLDADYFNEGHCVDCGSSSVADQCQCCGGGLCYMHSETGAGFCKNCPTQEWIAEQQERMRDNDAN